MERTDRPYCDVCGGIVAAPPEGAPDPTDSDAALICDVCVRTRRVFPEGAVTPADERAGIASRFRCPHCDRRLKTRTIKVRTEVDCPRCKGKLSLLPDGSVEAGLPSWPRPPGKDDKGGGDDGDGEGEGDADADAGEGAEDAAGSEAARASGPGAARAGGAADRAASRTSARAAEERGPGGDLPSDLAEMLATRAAFDARAASDSTETITGPARRAAAAADWQRSVSADSAALASSGERRVSASGSGSSDRVPVSGERVLSVSSSEWPAAPTFKPHASAEAEGARAPSLASGASASAPVPAPAPSASAPTTRVLTTTSPAARTPPPASASRGEPRSEPRSEPAPRSERRAPVVASIDPASPDTAAAGAAPRAPWIRVAIAAVLVLGGVGGAFLVRGAQGVPGPVSALGDRIGKGFQHLEARLK